MCHIVYEKHKSGTYHVTLPIISQTIVVTPGFFKKTIGTKGNILIGCCDISYETLYKLGFVPSN